MEIETIGIKDSIEDSEDEIAYQMFKDSVEFHDGRYYVTWPWKDGEPDLPTNYALALSRFKSVAQRLFDDPELLKQYDSIMQEQLRRGIIEKVSADSEEGRLKHYIPHHPVITPSKTTTKVRLVYDASAKTKKSNNSLNECLYRGPVLLQDLCGLLLWFLLPKIGLMSDIEKAFLQVGLQMQDRDVTRFFWFINPDVHKFNGNVQVYRFCRIPFGVISSPFLLAATINHHLEKFEHEVNSKIAPTDIAKQIKDNMYVDNVITGANDVNDAIQFYKVSQDIFNAMSMNLREWASNSSEFLDSIPEKHHSVGVIFKVLGMNWNTKEDTLSISSSRYSSVSINKLLIL